MALPSFPKLNPLLLITMSLWGFNFVALKLIYVQMTPAAVSVVRFCLMYAALLAICGVLRIPLRLPKGKAFRIFAMGFLAMGIYMVFFLEGMKDSTAAEGAIILGTSPIFTLLIAVAAKQERFSAGALGGALLAFGGVALVVLSNAGGDPGTIKGNLLVLVSSALWAWSAVISRPLVSEHNPLQIITLSMPAALLALLPYGASEALSLDPTSLTPLTLVMVMFLSVGAGAVGFACFYAGVKQVGAAGAMLYQYLVAPLAVLFSFIFLPNTRIHPLQIVGLAVVLTGVAIATHARQKHQTLIGHKPKAA